MKENLWMITERYRCLTESCAIGIWQISSEGKTIYMNPAMCRMLEISSPEEIGNQTFHKFFTDESLEKVTIEHEKRKAGVSSTYEAEIVGQQGNRKSVLICGSPVRNRSGDLDSLIATFIDITELKNAMKALETSERKYKELADLLPETVIEFDVQGNLLFANKNSKELFGYSGEEFNERLNIFQMIVPEDLKRARENLKRRLRGEVFGPSEYTALKKDGSTFPVMIYTNQVIEENRVVGMRVIAVDISERKRTESKLQAVQQELEIKAKNLEESNTALKVLLKHQEEEKHIDRNKISKNIQELVVPYLRKLKTTVSDERQETYINIIETNLNEITRSFFSHLRDYHAAFTPAEMQVAKLICDDRTTKEIANILHISESTVFTHRRHIRNKLGIKKEKSNLRSYLQSLQNKQ